MRKVKWLITQIQRGLQAGTSVSQNKNIYKYCALTLFLTPIFLSSCATQNKIHNGICVPDVESPSIIANSAEKFDEPFFDCNSYIEGIRLYTITAQNVMYITILKDESSVSISAKNATPFIFEEIMDYKLELSEKDWKDFVKKIDDNYLLNLKKVTVKEQLTCMNLGDGIMWKPTAKKYILELMIRGEYKYFYIRDIYNSSTYGKKNRKKPDDKDVLMNFIYYLIDFAILKYSDKNIEKYKDDKWDNKIFHIKNYCPPIED